MKAIALLLIFPALCAAQAEAPVPKPDVKVGDRWTYRRMDYDENKPRGKYEMRVVFIGRGVIQVVTTDNLKDEEGDATFTSDWNAVTTPARLFNPHTGWFRFPLQAGATYSATYETMMPKKGANSRNERQVKVIGWEEVVVPAGKFRALKIVSDGTYQRTDNTFFSGTSRNVIWYVPEIKRWAKLTLENRPRGSKGKGEHAGEELLDYKVQ